MTTVGVILATFALESSLAWQTARGMARMALAWPAPSPRLYFSSALVSVIDLVVMAVVWESLRRWRWIGSLTASIFATLLATLAGDSLLFPLLALGRIPEAEALMQGALAERLILVLWLSPVLGAYVRWQQRLYGSDLGQARCSPSWSAAPRREAPRTGPRPRSGSGCGSRKSCGAADSAADRARQLPGRGVPQRRPRPLPPFFEQALGVGKDAAIGKTDFELRDPAVADRMQQVDLQVMESGEGSQYEEELAGPDGKVHTFVTNKVPLFDENGGVYGLCGFATDITERKAAEKKDEENQRRLQLNQRRLQMNQRRLQLAMDAAAAGTFVWNSPPRWSGTSAR